jgi:hypothetical protein
LSRRFPRAAVAGALAAFAAVAPAAAQLRPLEPVSWRVFREDATLTAEVGGAALRGQRASLAGAEGPLWEAATFSVVWRSGRIALEAAGTGQRFFREETRFAPPYEDVEPAGDDGKRRDSGDYRISTAVRLTGEGANTAALLRFGTRLPTTDNTTGLDRDALDFFATLAGQTRRGPLSVGLEAGLGIHTTRETRFEQDDLLLYAARAEWDGGLVVPALTLVGQVHGAGHREIRGVEDLGEARLGVRVGRRRWVRVEAVKGYEAFSPSWGVVAAAGVAR